MPHLGTDAPSEDRKAEPKDSGAPDAPRVVTPAHEHPHEQITLVERGRVLFTVGEELREASAGDVLHFPPGSWHGATMLDEEVVLIDIFSPIREDFLAAPGPDGDGEGKGL